ncbi:MAG: sigma-E processing peptidase SpoIIGA [Halanaerobium sp.]|nr:sigma-E processing peptidase SpoIIGA [Halanaerobium sp.]
MPSITIDLDLLFLNNFFLTLITFLLVTILLGRETSWGRLFCISLVSSLIMLLFICNPGYHPAILFLFHPLVTVAFVKFLYKPINLWKSLQAAGLAYLTAAAAAGISILAFSALQGSFSFWLEDKLGLNSFNLYYLWLSLCFLLLVGWKIIQQVKANLHKKKGIVWLEIGYRGRQVTIRAYQDTGNQLRDPLTGFPVIIAEAKAVENLFTVQPEWTMDELEGIRRELGSKFCLIPFKGIDRRENGLLPGFRPDFVELLPETGGNCPNRTDRVILGISSSCLDPDYQALLPVGLMIDGEE